jgi:hypothetical protein
LNDYQLNKPKFNNYDGTFISNFYNEDREKYIVATPNFRILSYGDSILELEFLPSSNEFYKFISQVDDIFVQSIVKSGNEWFDKDLNNHTVNNLFKSSLNIPKKIPSLPFIRVMTTDETKVIGKKRKKGNLGDVKLNSEVQLKMSIVGVVFEMNKCCVLYVATEIKIVNDVCQSFECLFDDENGDDLDQDSETNDVTASVVH